MHCSLIYYRIGLWRHHFKMDALSKQLHQAPVLGEDTDVIYLHSCDLNTKFDFTVPSLQFLRLTVVFYRPRGEFWMNSTAWDFYSLYRLLKKLKRKLGFLFAGKGKLFIMKLFFEEFNLIFFTAESAWTVQMQPRQRRFRRILRYIFYSMVKEITLLKGYLSIYKCFIDV